MTLILLMLFPLIWPFVAKMIWGRELTIGEIAINLGVGVVFVALGWYLGTNSVMADVEIRNGVVTSKAKELTSCEHSYPCRCDKNGCSTCYQHSHDYDYKVDTSAGKFFIKRVDSQGAREPERFTAVKIGEPVSLKHSYDNYVKAAPDSLFNHLADKQAMEAFAGQIPAYPSQVFDYHHVDRVLTNGVTLPDAQRWNRELEATLSRLGPRKQVNVVLLFTSNSDPMYATALRAAWLGGKKNDVVVVMGTPSYPEISWVRVISWTDAELFKVHLRDALLDLKTVDRTALLSLVESHVEKAFVRKQMADFAYLKGQIEPPGWVIACLAVFGALGSMGLSFYLANNQYATARFRRIW